MLNSSSNLGNRLNVAKKRQIDPDSYTDDKLAFLSIGAHFLFYATVVLADDEGRIRWSARQFKARVFASKDGVTLEDVEKWMAELVAENAIKIYDNNGTVFAFHPQFKKHQWINKPTASKLPAPPPSLFDALPGFNGESQESTENHRDSCDSTDNHPNQSQMGPIMVLGSYMSNGVEANASPPPIPDGIGPPPSGKSPRKPRVAEPLPDIPADCRKNYDRLVEADAKERRGKVMADSVVEANKKTLMLAFESKGIDALRHGMDIALRKGLGVRFAAGCVRKYDPVRDGPSAISNGSRPAQRRVYTPTDDELR
jgi:hypothetical protein